jgi:hypothetical protein
MQRIINTTDCYKSNLFFKKIEDTCNLFQIELEKYLRTIYWSNLYDEDVFKDLHENTRICTDFRRLSIIEEDIWTSFLANPTVLDADRCNVNLSLNLVTSNKFDMDMIWGHKRCPIKQVIISNSEVLDASSKPEKQIKFKVVKLSDQPELTPKPPKVKNFIKFTKKENVDKKLLRKFKKYLKDLLKENKLSFISDFWKSFIKGKLLPPVNYKPPGTDKCIQFKSFNTKYLLWLFSHEGGVELYNQFVENKSEEIFSLLEDIVVDDQQKVDLGNYINSLADIYSNNKPVGQSHQEQISKEVLSGEPGQNNADVENNSVSGM